MLVRPQIRRTRYGLAVALAGVLGLLLAPSSGPLSIGVSPSPPSSHAAASDVDGLPNGAEIVDVGSVYGRPFSLLPTFSLLSKTPFETLSTKFWGSDVRIYGPANSSLAAGFNATGLTYVRWPGGRVADQYNISANRINQGGSAYNTPPTSMTQFATWCGWVSCRAIVQLPAEINSSSTGAYYVHYIEKVVGFHPAYYEIGNEPALWRHFNIPWSKWNSTQRSKITAMGYAYVVQSYLRAIRAVDPHAQILGLPGFGQGGYHEPTWIQDTVAVNGPNLSGVAIHVYPSGAGPASNPSLATFYSSLNGRGTIANRVPRDRAAIAAGCPTCTGIPVFITEMGAGNGGGSYKQFMSSYANVPYIATEILQGVEVNVTNIDIFALQSRYTGSLMSGSSQLSDIGVLYKDFFTPLGRGVLPTSNVTLNTGVRMMALLGSDPGSYAVLFISTNTTSSQKISLTGSGFPVLGLGEVVAWSNATAAPSIHNYSVSVPLTYTIPAGGILLVVSNL